MMFKMTGRSDLNETLEELEAVTFCLTTISFSFAALTCLKRSANLVACSH